ncbi:hypothetical protein CYY_001636 [Polysphondylium violaceum]|uniref:Inositol 1 n=1 Tax=Polysphondylium violaceum TaxID=133409 RepID=A0A8J4VAF2_9MYCE|nr:hypothetical protein CYY_001636 [Polysphondylium violaceum]
MEDSIKSSLKTGDSVTFFSEQEEEDGYFSKAHDSAVLNSSKTKECVFKIYPFTQYTARKAFKKKAKRKLLQQQQQTGDNSSGNLASSSNNNNNNNNGAPMSMTEVNNAEVTDLELKQLEEYQDLEDVNNESTLIQLEGRDLVYGQIIQLFHPPTNQFLFAKNYDSNNNIVGFRQDGDQKCYFKITPRFASLDGCKVFNDDLILLRHEKSGLFLKETNFFNDQGLFDIGLTESGTFWKISISDVDGKSSQNVVKANEPFRLFHREGGFVKVSKDDTTTFSYSTKTPSSINSLFEIELENRAITSSSVPNSPSVTGRTANPSAIPTTAVNGKETQLPPQSLLQPSTEVHYGQSFWIRLVGTRKYLSLEEILDEHKESSLIVVDEDQKYSPNATFQFLSKEKNSSSDDIVFGSFVRIQTLSKHYLHFLSDETFHHNGDLVGSKKYYKNDDFQIKQVPKSQLEDYNFVVQRIQKIQAYLSQSQLPIPSPGLSINNSSVQYLNPNSQVQQQQNYKKITNQEIKFIIVEFIKFCTQSEIEDPLEREGTPIKNHQKLLSHKSHFPVILEFLSKIFDPLDGITVIFIYRLLKQMAKSNIKNGIIINEHLDVIAGPEALREKVVSYGLGAILLEIYKNNNILLEALTEDKVLEFINIIKRTKDPKLMELLSEICLCFGKPIVKNQQFLCNLLFEKNSSLLFKTRVNNSTIEVEKANGTWQDIGHFVFSVDEKTHKYFEQTLSLYANISKGRNYNGIRLAGQRAPYKECLVCLKDETLPFGLRGCYINILIHVYMDCYPQTHAADINYVWNPYIVDRSKTLEFIQQHQLQQSALPSNASTTGTTGKSSGYNTISSGNIIISNSGQIGPSNANSPILPNAPGFMNTGPNYQGGASNMLVASSTAGTLAASTATSPIPSNPLADSIQSPASPNGAALPPSGGSHSGSVKRNSSLVGSIGPHYAHHIGGGSISSSSSIHNIFGSKEYASNSSTSVFKESDIFSTFLNSESHAVPEPITISQLLINLLLKSENFSSFTSYPHAHRPQLGFFHKILVAVNYAFKFGFFKKKERVVLTRLLTILAIENEGPTNTFKEADLGRTMGGSRMLEDDSVIFVNIKVEIIKILHLMLSLQKKNMLMVFLDDFHSLDQNTFQNPESVKGLVMERLASNHQKDFQQELSICQILFKLLKHENNGLSSLSLSLLNRIYKYRSIYSMLWKPIQKLFVLSLELTPIYQESLSKMEFLTKTCLDPLTDEKTEEVLKILVGFIHMCSDSDTEKRVKHQKLLRVMGVYKTIIGVLKIGCSLDDLILDVDGDDPNSNNIRSIFKSTSSASESVHVAKIFRCCYEFLKVFCLKNEENQVILFGEIEFLIGHLIRYGNVFGTVETLMEVFKNNLPLSVKFGNSPYLKILIKFIINQNTDNLDPMFLKLLSTIMLPGGVSSDDAVIENQLAVTNLLKEYQDKITKLLVPVHVIKEVMKEPKGSNLSKHYSASSSKIYKLHLALQEILVHALQYDDSSLAPGNPNTLVTSGGATAPSSNTNSSQAFGNTLSSRSSIAPKLMRSSAKQQIITSSVEVLPKEFVINLDLILLLKSCSHGKNTPTEVICREFLSMSDCFDILVVRSDGQGKDNSSLMIHDTKEYLENNLLFRFKSAYLSFLHEVFFNSDTLKGDLLALQLNENLWNLIDQFTNQLNYLFTCSARKQMSEIYYVMMARNIILPMASILERFYSQCFYFDKATQTHLTYSSKIMAALMKLYWVDPSLSFTTFATPKFKSIADDSSAGGLHPIIQGLEIEEKIQIFTSLTKCLKAMDRSALSPMMAPNVSSLNISDVIKGCEEVIARLDSSSRYHRHRAETIDAGVGMAVLSKPSTSFYFDYSNKEDNYVKESKKRGYIEIAKLVNAGLMINKQPPSPVSIHSDQDPILQGRIPMSSPRFNSYSTLTSPPPIPHLSQNPHHAISSGSLSSSHSDKTTNFLEILVFQLRNSLYDNDEMKINCIRILSSLLSVNLARKRDIQNLMSDLYCHSAAIGLLSSKNLEIAFESLSLLLALLEENDSLVNPIPNSKVKDDIQSHFSSSPDIQFFRDIFAMIERAKINLKDTKRSIRIENGKIIGANFSAAANFNFRSSKQHIADQTAVNPYSTEFLLLKNVFRVLQLLCQGSANIFKKNIRSQPDNYKSYDILKEMCQFLKILETIVDIDIDSIDLAHRFFSCMKEIVKNTPDNQLAAISNVQVCKAISNILKKHKDINPNNIKDAKYIELKIEVVDFLLHIVDKEDPRVVSKLIPELDYKVIEANTQIMSQKSGSSEINEKLIKLASMSFRLIKILADNDKSQNRQLVECLLKCGEHCKSRIGRVELFCRDKLERIYFPIPSYSRRLILEDKESSKIKSDENQLQENLEEHFLSNQINWNKTSEKIDAFMDWSEYKLIELEHLHHLKNQTLSYLLVSHMRKFKFISFILALAINILLLIFSTTLPKEFKQDFGKTNFYAAYIPLAILQTIACIIACAGFFLRYGPVLLYQNWVKYLKFHGGEKSYMFLTNDQRMDTLRQKFKYGFIPLNAKFLLTDLRSVYNIFAVVFSIIGVAYSPYFFAYHIFQFSLHTKALGIVISALSVNKKTLLVMGIFILQANYLLSIFSYVFFNEKYIMDGNNFCTTLFQCFISNLFYGLPTQGQLVQFVSYNSYEPDTNTGTGHTVAWTAYNLVFYIIVSIILLNVILGIIVDTFGQLRDQRASTEEYKSNVCFICSIERETFQKKSIDFLKHIEDDHNKWHYLYFFAYLKERVSNGQLNQLNELEIYVLDSITNRSYINFFPYEMSMSLQGIENDKKSNNSTADQFNKSLEDVEKKISNNISSQMNQTVSLLIDEVKSLRQQLIEMKLQQQNK